MGAWGWMNQRQIMICDRGRGETNKVLIIFDILAPGMLLNGTCKRNIIECICYSIKIHVKGNTTVLVKLLTQDSNIHIKRF